MINKDTDNVVEGTAVATPVSTPATATAVATRVNIPPAYAPSYEQANVNHTQTFIVPAMGEKRRGPRQLYYQLFFTS